MVKQSAPRAGLDAEYSVIGSLLIEPSIAGELFAKCKASDFTRAELGTIYQAAQRLFSAGRPVDAVTIRAAAGKEYEPLLMECMDVTPSVVSWRTYASEMQEQTRVYRIRQLAEQLREVTTTEQARDLVVKASDTLTPQADDRIATAADLVATFFKRQTEKPEFIQFGITKLDKRVYAERGDFIVIAGRPSAGKTALSIQMASSMASQHRVGYFSLETSREKVADRWIANQCMINFGDIKRRALTPQDMECVVSRKKDLMALQVEYITASGMTVDDILHVALMRRFDVIFVDYLQLVHARGKDRFEQVTNVSVGLHSLSQSHGITVIALSQLSRNGSGQKPKLTDLRESGQIEQDADDVLFLYLENEDDEKSDRILCVAKNKEGGLGEIQLVFDGAKQLFIEYMDEPKKFVNLPRYKRARQEQQNDAQQTMKNA